MADGAAPLGSAEKDHKGTLDSESQTAAELEGPLEIWFSQEREPGPKVDRARLAMWSSAP
jgi:hypothetical protein